jgi:hypothetical protein
MAAVVLGNALGLAANAAAAVHASKAAEALGTVSALYAANSTDAVQEYLSTGLQETQRGGSILSVQRFCEVAVLLLIVVAFVAVGVLSARRVSARLLGVDATSASVATGRALWLRMVGVTACVFVSFLVRSVLSTMTAVSFELRDLGKTCPESAESIYCNACRNVYTHVTGWMVYSPAFESTIVLISSPVALLIALWGMTSKATLQVMKSRGQESAMTSRLIKSI